MKGVKPIDHLQYFQKDNINRVFLADVHHLVRYNGFGLWYIAANEQVIKKGEGRVLIIEVDEFILILA
jgi:hypothetical protein